MYCRNNNLLFHNDYQKKGLRGVEMYIFKTNIFSEPYTKQRVKENKTLERSKSIVLQHM